MLVIAKSFRELRLGELMAVYSQSNEETALQWPNLPRGYALQLAEQDFRQYLKDVFFHTPGALSMIWENAGRYVSALRLEPYKDGLLLEGLETLPCERRKGYAFCLLQAVQQNLAAMGYVKLYSHVEKRNVASMKTHGKAGFRIISDRAVYINGNVDYRCHTLLYEVSENPAP